jgi:hypothetical protein
MTIMPNAQRPRPGCLAGIFRSLLIFFVLGGVLVLGIAAVFTPWAFYLGGHFHILPQWQGWGRTHSPAGDYIVFVQMQPARRGSWGMPNSISGSGAVCTPRGESFSNLRVSGGFLNRRIGVNTDEEPFTLSLGERLNFLGTNQGSRLGFSFYGAWHNPDLVLDDRGSMARAFNPDGTIYVGDPHKRPAAGTPLQLTLHPGSRSDFDSACAAAKHR